MPIIIIDTNVFISALRSDEGAAYILLSLLGTGKFRIAVSVPLVLEYEYVAKRQSGAGIALSLSQIDDVLDYVCIVAERYEIYFLWRPFLTDPHDDMVIELGSVDK